MIDSVRTQLDIALIDTLAHYGKLGMRWGRRKGGPTGKGGRLTGGKLKPRKKPASDDHERAMTLKKKGAKHLSTKELQELNRRMELEKKYTEMTKNKSKYKEGKKLADEIAASGKTVNELITQSVKLYNSPLGKVAVKAVRERKKKKVV